MTSLFAEPSARYLKVAGSMGFKGDFCQWEGLLRIGE
jgi:hypothetical protein